jgi:hypothetical protein
MKCVPYFLRMSILILALMAATQADKPQSTDASPGVWTTVNDNDPA